MASTTSEIASSSSTRRRTYDVFLSFCGQDTRNGFADHLCLAMKQKGIDVFRDNEELVKGKNISVGLLNAIQESEFAVVVISENYVFSKWCLMELAKIAELQRETRLKVLPIFYRVNRYEQRNNFAEAFERHREDPEIGEEQRKEWRDALREVSDLAGWHVHDRPETTVIEEICREIVDGFSQNSSNISEEMPRIESWLEMLRPRFDYARKLLDFSLTPFFFLIFFEVSWDVVQQSLSEIVMNRGKCAEKDRPASLFPCSLILKVSPKSLPTVPPRPPHIVEKSNKAALASPLTRHPT